MFYSGGGGECSLSQANNPKWLIFQAEEIPKATLRTPSETETQSWRAWATGTEGSATKQSLSSMDAREMLWFSAVLWCVYKIKCQSELLTYEQMNCKLSFLAEHTACDIKNWHLRTKGILVSIEHSNAKHRGKVPPFNGHLLLNSKYVPSTQCSTLKT